MVRLRTDHRARNPKTADFASINTHRLRRSGAELHRSMIKCRSSRGGRSVAPTQAGNQGCLLPPKVRDPVSSANSKRVDRHISQTWCPWNVKFSQERAEESPFRAREFIAGKDAVTLARDILALDHEQFSAAFQKSPMKRAKLAGLKRNAAIALENASWGPSP